VISIEVTKGIWCGDADGWERYRYNRYGSAVHCCKEPYHREALGYKGRGAPQGDEYLYAIRGNEISLNMVDVDMVDWISDEMVIKAIEFIDRMVREGKVVYVHCNEGHSRGPGVCMAYMRYMGSYDGKTYTEAKKWFMETYPMYLPKRGIEGWLIKNWDSIPFV